MREQVSTAPAPGQSSPIHLAAASVPCGGQHGRGRVERVQNLAFQQNSGEIQELGMPRREAGQT